MQVLVFMPSLPKNAAGKPVRANLAQRLQIDANYDGEVKLLRELG